MAAENAEDAELADANRARFARRSIQKMNLILNSGISCATKVAVYSALSAFSAAINGRGKR
jgi:hypothetical protein